MLWIRYSSTQVSPKYFVNLPHQCASNGYPFILLGGVGGGGHCEYLKEKDKLTIKATKRHINFSSLRFRPLLLIRTVEGDKLKAVFPGVEH